MSAISRECYRVRTVAAQVNEQVVLGQMKAGIPDTWQVISTREEWDALEQDWSKLFECNAAHRPFQAWGWVRAWLDHIVANYQLHIIIRRDHAGRLRFVLPMIKVQSGLPFLYTDFRFVCGSGPECSDHSHCLRAPDLEDDVVELAKSAIAMNCPRDARIRIGNLDSSGEFASRLGRALQDDGFLVRILPQDVCPALDLPDSWDEYLKSCSSNFRAQTRRNHRRVNEHDEFRFRSLDSQEAPHFAAELIRLNRHRIGDKGEESSLEIRELREFLAQAIPALAGSGHAWLDVIEDDKGIVAAALNLFHGDTAYFYMGGFDERASDLRPGSALFARVLMRAIEMGISRYDFLRGSDSYKYRWGARDAAIFELYIYPRTPVFGRLVYAGECVYAALRDVARSIWRRSR